MRLPSALVGGVLSACLVYACVGDDLSSGSDAGSEASAPNNDASSEPADGGQLDVSSAPADASSDADGSIPDGGADATLVCTSDAGCAPDGGALDEPVQVTTGSLFGCVLLRNGDVHCVGSGAKGSVGVGPLPDCAGACSASFRKVATGMQTISAGVQTACGVHLDGSVRCWGDNLYGQLAQPVTTTTSPAPIIVALPRKAVQVVAGSHHVCALIEGATPTAARDIYCWGERRYGRFGDGAPGASGDVLPPTQVSTGAFAPASIVMAASNSLDEHVCALDTMGTGTLCWGANVASQIRTAAEGGGAGCGDTPNYACEPTPYGRAAAEALSEVIATGEATCELRKISGKVFCRGADTGVLGFCSGTSPNALTEVPTIPAMKHIDGDGNTVCGITTNDEVYCWGQNTWGNVGNGARTELTGGCVSHAAPPNKVMMGGAPLTVKVISTSVFGTLALGTNGRIYGWGRNALGMLGREPTSDQDICPAATSETSTTCLPSPVELSRNW